MRWELFFFHTCSVFFLGVELYVLVLHSNENPIYVFPEKELRGLSPNFHIHDLWQKCLSQTNFFRPSDINK